jgi:hypothetical protein
MENPNTGIIKKAPVGISYTTLFFGGFPALFRGDLMWFLIQVLIRHCVKCGKQFFTSGLTSFPVLFNK